MQSQSSERDKFDTLYIITMTKIVNTKIHIFYECHEIKSPFICDQKIARPKTDLDPLGSAGFRPCIDVTHHTICCYYLGHIRLNHTTYNTDTVKMKMKQTEGEHSSAFRNGKTSGFHIIGLTSTA